MDKMEGLKGIMKRPNGQHDGLQKSINCDSKHSVADKQNTVNGGGQLPSLTRDDHPADHNLLLNSLSARLRKSLSGEAAKKKSMRRGSKDHVFHLTQPENGVIDPDVYEKIRQQQQEKKHTEWSRRKQDKLQTRLMSWAVEAGRYLPQLNQNGDDGGERGGGRAGKDCENGSSFDFKEKIGFDDFPRGHGNSVVSYSSYLGGDSVRVMKKDGVFRPVNKYAVSRHRRGADDIPFSDTLLDYETVTLPLTDKTRDQFDTDISRNRKGLSVSWSAHSHHVESVDEKQLDKDSKAGSAKSFMSESAGWKRPNFGSGRSRVDRVGIKWKLPLPRRPKQKYISRPTRVGVSKNLTPVTSGLDRAGTSLERTRWQVPCQSSPESGYPVRSGDDVQRSLRAMRHLSFLSGNSSPRKVVTFSEKSAGSVCCESY